MDLVTWIFEKTTLFNLACCKITDLVMRRKIQTIDEIVIYSRFPVRTVLLTIDYLLKKDKIRFSNRRKSNYLLPINSKHMQKDTSIEINNISNLYLKAYQHREEPALLWSQRRLTPTFAINRAVYILDKIEKQSGKVVFLGDDDLVSPIISAMLPSWDVFVIDIDKAVLDTVNDTAKILKTKVITLHEDISKFSKKYSNYFDVAICDPFPTGDGSFEVMFWEYAALVLKNESVLITTVAPSHKPIYFSDKAISFLGKLGFSIYDIEANHDAYEVFEFEFTEYEKMILFQNNLKSSVSQTKSILTAILSSRVKKDTIESEFDFITWTKAISEHYLTRQAGYEEQICIAKNRGINNCDFSITNTKTDCGYDLNLLFSGDNKHKTFEQIINKLDRNNVNINEKDRNELIRLSQSKEISDNPSLSSLGLALRALESWNRYKFE